MREQGGRERWRGKRRRRSGGAAREERGPGCTRLDCVLCLQGRHGLVELLHLACVRVRLLLRSTEGSTVQLRDPVHFRLCCHPCLVHLMRALQVFGHHCAEILLQHGKLVLELLHAAFTHRKTNFDHKWGR